MLKLFFIALCVTYVYAQYECGKSFPPKRRSGEIVSGYRSYAGLFPWMVSLQVKIDQQNYKHVCAGTIISDEWVLTAAHCVQDPDSSIDRINAGSLLWNYTISVVVPVKIIIHSSSRSTSDIALIKVTPPFLFKQGDDDEGAVNRVCLPTDEQQFTGKVTISGWGSTKEEDNNNNATIHRELFAANVPLIDDLVCQQYSNIFSPGPYTCAGPSNKRSRQGGCYGDSGGPLIGVINKKAYLVGILSGADAATQCVTSEKPLLFSKVSTFRKWIRVNTGV